MRKVILMILAVVSSNAMADWVQVGNNANFNSYADPSSIQKEGIKTMDGSKAKMASLIDYVKSMSKAGKTYTSVKVQHEFDCRAEQVRMLSSSAYSGHMASGEVVESTFMPERWRPVPTRSIEEILWKVACGKH